MGNPLTGQRLQREHTIWGKADEYSRLCHAAVFVVIQRYGEDVKRVYHSHYDSDWPNLSWPEMVSPACLDPPMTLADPSQKEYGYPKVIAHTPDTVRARKLRLSTLAGAAGDDAPGSDNDDGAHANTSMDMVDEEDGATESNSFDVAHYLVDASDPDATEDEAGPYSGAVNTSRLHLPPPQAAAGRMLHDSDPSPAVKPAGLAQVRRPDPVTPDPPNPATQKLLSSLTQRRVGSSSDGSGPVLYSGPALGGNLGGSLDGDLGGSLGGAQAGKEAQRSRVPTIFQHQAGPHTPSTFGKPVYGVPSPLPQTGKYGYDQRRMLPVEEATISPSVLADRKRRRLKEIPELGRTPTGSAPKNRVNKPSTTARRLQSVQRASKISKLRKRGRLGRFEKAE